MRRELGEIADQTYFEVARVELNFWTYEIASRFRFPGLIEEGNRLLVAEGINKGGQLVQAVVIEGVDDHLFYTDLRYKGRVARMACEIFGLDMTVETSALFAYILRVQSPGQAET